MDRLAQLFADKTQRWQRASEIMDLAQRENRAMTEAERASYNEHVQVMDALDVEIHDIEEHNRRAAGINEPRRDPRIVQDPEENDTDREEDSAAYRSVFSRYIRFGVSELEPAERRRLRAGYRSARKDDGNQGEQRALNGQIGAQGGFLIPTTFQATLKEAQALFGGVLQAVGGQLTTERGEEINWPTTDDTAELGERLGENQAATELDPTFDFVSIRAYIYSSKIVRIPLALLEDSAVDLESHLGQRLGRRLARVKNRDFTLGTGDSQPKGVQYGAANGKTAASATAITFVELVALEHSVDPAYRDPATCLYMWNDATLLAARSLLDSTGRPLWQPSLERGMAQTINNYRYVVNQSMPNMATTTKPILFGSFVDYYQIRQAGGTTLLRMDERYAEFLQAGFLAFERFDGQIVNVAAVKAMTMA